MLMTVAAFGTVFVAMFFGCPLCDDLNLVSLCILAES